MPVLFNDGFETATALVGPGPDPDALAPSSLTTTITYLHTDPLGSPVAETNTNGTVIKRNRFEPFGYPLNTPTEGQPSYTGHQYDSFTDLIYAQQRYYDPKRVGFVSVDPLEGNSNRYWYADNNPYRNYDPDGRCTGSHIANDDGTCASTDTFTTKDPGARTASNDGPMGDVSVPKNITVEQSGFKTPNQAAKAFGDRYYKKGVNKRSEFQTAVVRLGRRNYGYISPGAAPPGVTRVDPTKIFNAIVGAGYAVVAWAHTHWDNNLLFSGADMQFVYKTRPNGVLFMANSQGNSFRLDYGELRSASSDYRGANGVMQFILSVREIQGEPIQ